MFVVVVVGGGLGSCASGAVAVDFSAPNVRIVYAQCSSRHTHNHRSIMAQARRGNLRVQVKPWPLTLRTHRCRQWCKCGYPGAARGQTSLTQSHVRKGLIFHPEASLGQTSLQFRTPPSRTDHRISGIGHLAGQIEPTPIRSGAGENIPWLARGHP